MPLRSTQLHSAWQCEMDDQGAKDGESGKYKTEITDGNENGDSYGTNVNRAGNYTENGDKNNRDTTNKGKEAKEKHYNETRRDRKINSCSVDNEAKETNRDEDCMGNTAKRTESKDPRQWYRKLKGAHSMSLKQDNNDKENEGWKRGEEEHRRKCKKSKKEQEINVETNEEGMTEREQRQGGGVSGNVMNTCYCCAPKISTSPNLTTCPNCMPQLACW